MEYRYLVQFWSDKDQDYLTDCAFQDSDQHLDAAKTYIEKVLSSQDAPEAGRIYDLQELKIVHLVSNIPF